MLNLTKHEKQIIIFLFFTALVGLGISYYKKVTHQVDLTFIPSPISKQDIDNLVGQAEVVNPVRDIKDSALESKISNGVNINTSDVGELTTLPGIGPVLAKRANLLVNLSQCILRRLGQFREISLDKIVRSGYEDI